jgi:hypothetical protein
MVAAEDVPDLAAVAFTLVVNLPAANPSPPWPSPPIIAAVRYVLWVRAGRPRGRVSRARQFGPTPPLTKDAGVGFADFFVRLIDLAVSAMIAPAAARTSPQLLPSPPDTAVSNSWRASEADSTSPIVSNIVMAVVRTCTAPSNCPAWISVLPR